jgi:putative spermidine/putrescine transport system permease protein
LIGVRGKPCTPISNQKEKMLNKVSSWLHTHKNIRLVALISAPALWLVVAYLGALLSLLVTAFYTTNSFTGDLVATFTLENFADLFGTQAYMNVVFRTLFIALMVTIISALLAIPMGFYMSKLAKPKAQGILLALVLTPLWASYLVKIYAWRTMLEPNAGVLDWLFGDASPGFGMTAVIIGLTYLWLPYMILPVYSAFEKLPNSLLDASSDLGAKNFQSFYRIVIPMVYPGIIAGSMFTFSLSLGDYITTQIIGGQLQMLGNVVYQNFSLNLPFAAAFSTVPIVIMGIYLWMVKRTGALQNL